MTEDLASPIADVKPGSRGLDKSVGPNPNFQRSLAKVITTQQYQQRNLRSRDKNNREKSSQSKHRDERFRGSSDLAKLLGISDKTNYGI